MRVAYLICGLGFGDEGKGSIVDFLCRSRDVGMVVRYNGGSQAAHNVVTPEGIHHTFSQFGSGTLASDKVRTHLSRFMLVNPLNMMAEAKGLKEIGVQDIWFRTTVEQGVVIITPFQVALNRALEMLRGDRAHGSCGQGIGIARAHHLDYGDKVLFAGEISKETLAKEKLYFIQQLCRRELDGERECLTMTQAIYDSCDLDVIYDTGAVEWAWKQYSQWPAQIVPSRYLAHWCASTKSDILFEGAQGVLLDEIYGFKPPHVTWTDTTMRNAELLLDECEWPWSKNRIGVIRTYFTRHGNGPFPTESKSLGELLPEEHNDDIGFQGKFRLGYFDSNLFKMGLKVNPVDGIAMNHLDKWRLPPHFCEHLECETKVPFIIDGYGPSADRKRYRKAGHEGSLSRRSAPSRASIS
jgi:adenylosuccinate synthase